MIKPRETQFLHSFLVAFLFVLALAASFVFVVHPSCAYAKSYSSGPVDIQAEVDKNGALSIEEQRTFTFEGDYSCVWWSLDDLPEGADVSVYGMTMTTANDEVELPEISFKKSWRDAGGPDGEAWSFDRAKNTIYAFFDVNDAEVTFTVNYTVNKAVQVYSDTAELYWQFVGSGWAVDSSDVSATITLPVAKGDSVVAGDTVKAWGHGVLNGSVKIRDDGSVVYRVPLVSAGSYSEARIAFPTKWVSGVKPGAVNYHDSKRLKQIQTEEEQWAGESNDIRMAQIGSLVAAVLISLLAIIWGIWRFFRYGRELKPNFTDTYWRDDPLPGSHPAVVGRLMRFDSESIKDFSGTLLNLANEGALRIEPVVTEKKVLFLSKSNQDYALVRNSDFDESTLHQLDRDALDIVFNLVGKGSDSVLLSSFSDSAKDCAEVFSERIESWQGLLSSEVIKADIIEGYSRTKRRTNFIVAFVVVLACIVLSGELENILCVIPGLISAIVLVVLGNFMPRRTQKGADAYARSQALKKWLCEFSLLKERPFTDVKVWGKLMVYAFILDVADQAAKQMRSVGENLTGTTQVGSVYDPGFWWYYPMIVHPSSVGSGFDLGDFMDSLDTSLSTSVQAVSSVLSDLGDGDGGFSSGGGFGGGFSMGGGGGFGGGGGAR